MKYSILKPIVAGALIGAALFFAPFLVLRIILFVLIFGLIFRLFIGRRFGRFGGPPMHPGFQKKYAVWATRSMPSSNKNSITAAVGTIINNRKATLYNHNAKNNIYEKK